MPARSTWHFGNFALRSFSFRVGAHTQSAPPPSPAQLSTGTIAANFAGTAVFGTHKPVPAQHCLSKTTGGFFGESPFKLHAPVSWPVRGSVHGAHSSSAAHPPAGSRSVFLDTSATHFDKQRPSAPATESHVRG